MRARVLSLVGFELPFDPTRWVTSAMMRILCTISKAVDTGEALIRRAKMIIGCIIIIIVYSGL